MLDISSELTVMATSTQSSNQKINELLKELDRLTGLNSLIAPVRLVDSELPLASFNSDKMQFVFSSNVCADDIKMRQAVEKVYIMFCVYNIYQGKPSRHNIQSCEAFLRKMGHKRSSAND